MKQEGGPAIGRYFTLDRAGSLRPGLRVGLTKHDVNEPYASHLQFLFPEGVTLHGESYIVSDSKRPTEIEAAIELLFEYVRRSHFPNRPSRLQTFYAFESVEMAWAFRTQFAEGLGSVWEVEGTAAFAGDMRHLDLGNTPLTASYCAHRYWEGSSSENPLWEQLLVPPVTVIDRASGD